MQVSKRQLLISSGVLASGGLFAVSQATETDAQTEITLQEFTIPDTTESVESVSEVPINVTVRADWESTGATDLEISLYAGLEQSTATELTTETFQITETGDKTFELSGDVLKASSVSKDMLDPSIGPSINLSIGVATTLLADGETVDTTELWDTAELTVNDDVIEGSLTTGAKGELSVTE